MLGSWKSNFEECRLIHLYKYVVCALNFKFVILLITYAPFSMAGVCSLCNLQNKIFFFLSKFDKKKKNLQNNWCKSLSLVNTMKLYREEQIQERLLLRNRNECPVPIQSSNARILKYELNLKCKLTSEGGGEGKKEKTNQRDIPSQTLLFLPISSSMVK